jgi:hypothetical protein
MMTVAARDARPPLSLVRMMNLIMRVFLRTPLGRMVRPFALLEFTGRRSARRFLVPVGWHEIDSGHVAFTPAPWRAHFRNGIPVTVWLRGQRQNLIGVLDDDPEQVAVALQSLADHRGSLRPIGVDIPAGHRLTAADVAAVDRAVIRFQPARLAEAPRGGAVDEASPRMRPCPLGGLRITIIVCGGSPIGPQAWRRR